MRTKINPSISKQSVDASKVDSALKKKLVFTSTEINHPISKKSVDASQVDSALKKKPVFTRTQFRVTMLLK